jgi:quercetin dioxygenase-like cupin family protein
VLLDDVGEVARRGDAHHAGDAHRGPRGDQGTRALASHRVAFFQARRPQPGEDRPMTENPTRTYGLVQLRELTDDAIAGGFADTLEARFARDELGCERIGLSLQRIKPGVRAPFAHRHSTDEELYVVVDGSGRAIVEGEVVDLRPWSALRVPAGAARSFEADAGGLEFLAFGTHTEGDRGEFVDAGWPE